MYVCMYACMCHVLDYLVYCRETKKEQYGQFYRTYYSYHKYCVRYGHIICIQKSTFSAGINIFNSLLLSVKILKNDKAKFKASLRNFLHAHHFYSVDEFYMCKDDL